MRDIAPRPPCSRAAGLRSRCVAGFSLTELLVAMTVALLVMASVATLFGTVGRAVSESQATIELSGRLRSAAWQLRQDLAGATVPLVPWTAPESNAGYFELLEGPQRDTTLAWVSGSATTNLEGDTDDILLFTTRSLGGPFVGKTPTGIIEADSAEVAWFCRESGSQPVTGTKMYNLHRRQLLVLGYVGTADFGTTNSMSGTLPNIAWDLSLRSEGGALVPNTLGDLTKRENRFLRSGTFPYVFLTDTTARAFSNATFDSTDRVWEDVILTNVIAFDVRVFDPQVRGQVGTVVTSYPGDFGYTAATAASGTGAFGAFVDLGWDRTMMTGTLVSGTVTATISGTRVPVAISGTFPPAGVTAFQSDGVTVRNAAVTSPPPSATYDTWSLHYEFNGLDDDGDGVVDDGSNGIDDNNNGMPDDPAEYETSPPYPVPLRGIEVRIRCYEPTSRQVRQVTVRHTFLKK